MRCAFVFGGQGLRLPGNAALSTDKMQPMIFEAAMKTFQTLQSTNEIRPSICLGHSLGELSALACSAHLSGNQEAVPLFSDIVQERGRLMQTIVDNNTYGKFGMVALLRTREAIDVHGVNDIIRRNRNDNVCIANYNAANQLVLSGQLDEQLSIGSELKSLKLIDRFTVLPNCQVPFHNAHILDPILQPFDAGSYLKYLN